MKKYGYGEFGNITAAYDKVRPGMPNEVLEYFLKEIPLNAPKVLDLGCGTGILTRQLAAMGVHVSGADKDVSMLSVARAYREPTVEYTEAATESLPFADNSYDALTAFSAFHWFSNAKAIEEIKRVTKSGGVFFIANRAASPEFRSYRAIINPFMRETFHDFRKTFDPKTMLLDAGFHDVRAREFHTREWLTPEDAVTYVTSTSPWNLIAEEKKEEAKQLLLDHFKGKITDGYVIKPVLITTFIGRVVK